jgi:flagellin
VISVNFNVARATANSAINRSGGELRTAIERLSTGLRINRASDDPSGMIAGENLKGQEASLRKKIESRNFNITFYAAREGAESALNEMLTNLNDLVIRAANKAATSPNEREAMQIEAAGIIAGIDYLASTTRFNGQLILQGRTSTNLGKVQVAVNPGQSASPAPDPNQSGVPITGATPQPTTRFAGLNEIANGALNLVNGDLEAAQQAVASALSSVTTSRGAIGAQIKSEQSEIAALNSELENIGAAKSQIMDADFAQETARLVRAQTLQSAAIFAAQMSADLIKNTMRSLQLLRDP